MTSPAPRRRMRPVLTRRLRGAAREDGFTLIELLIVILIIGVLAAIAVPMFLNQREQAQISALKSDMRHAAMEMHTFYAANPLDKSLPTANGDGTFGTSGWSVIVWGEGTDKFSGRWRNNNEPNVFLDGMKPFTVSEGISLGVVTSVYQGGSREAGDFCILGNAEGTRYAATNRLEHPEVSQFAAPLYYDSANGGFFDPEKLPKEGACAPYATRIENGN